MKYEADIDTAAYLAGAAAASRSKKQSDLDRISAAIRDRFPRVTSFLATAMEGNWSDEAADAGNCSYDVELRGDPRVSGCIVDLTHTATVRCVTHHQPAPGHGETR